jgi:hypothetical protein
MGASGKTLKSIAELVRGGLVPLGAKIAELGVQNLHCDPGAAAEFVQLFRDKGANVSISDNEAAKFGEGGHLGAMLNAVGFDYTAIDIFDAPNTRLHDLNIDFVEPDMLGKFDLVTNYGTTEHVINQMLAMRTIHDLAKVGGIIHHELPMGGYFLHCYFTYNPAVFHDLASANSYRLVEQKISSGPWRRTSKSLRERGFQDDQFRDYGIEIVLQKSTDAPFRIPVDNISSVAISRAAWTAHRDDEEIAISTVIPVDPDTMFARIPFRTIHAAYWSRLRFAILNHFIPPRG